MKKTMVSLATASLIATSAMAADKGIDIVTTGQAVIYYETHASGADNAPDIFNKDASAANVGVQLNLGADLGNNFTFGSQLSYLGTLGLENNLVSGVKQNAAMANNPSTADDIMMSKIFVAKKIGNTTVKLGRQELPKSLSPLAFTEGWNVFKNTFDAALVVNTDIPKTTLVGAYVGSVMGIMPQVGDPAKFKEYGKMYSAEVYMATAQTKAIPMTTLTGTYYNAPVPGVENDVTAYWLDAKIASKSLPLGLTTSFQAGMIAVDGADDDGMAIGVKVGIKPIKPLYLQVAYSSVDEHNRFKNMGTGIKTPLYTQMIYNQNAIACDNDTFVAKAVYNTGAYGKIIAQYGMTTTGSDNSIIGADNNYNELDVIYRIKSGGVSYWASVMMINTDDEGPASIIGGGGSDSDTKLRLWARLAF